MDHIIYPKELINIICRYDEYYFEGIITKTIDIESSINYIFEIDIGILIMFNDHFKIWDHNNGECLYESDKLTNLSCLNVMNEKIIICGFNDGNIKLFTKRQKMKRDGNELSVCYEEFDSVNINDIKITSIIGKDKDIISGFENGLIYL